MILEVEKPGSGNVVQKMEVEEEKETKTKSRIFDEVSKIKINEKQCEAQVTSFYEMLCGFLPSDVLSLPVSFFCCRDRSTLNKTSTASHPLRRRNFLSF